VKLSINHLLTDISRPPVSYPLKSEAYVTTVASAQALLTVVRGFNQPCIGLLSIQAWADESLSATEEREYELKVFVSSPELWSI
jgi:hypothetical protein